MTAEHWTWTASILTGISGVVAITWENMENNKVVTVLKVIFGVMIVLSIFAEIQASRMDEIEASSEKTKTDSIISSLTHHNKQQQWEFIAKMNEFSGQLKQYGLKLDTTDNRILHKGESVLPDSVIRKMNEASHKKGA